MNNNSEVKKLLEKVDEVMIAKKCARSVVDDRQPFFKSGAKLLTVKQKLGLLAH